MKNKIFTLITGTSVCILLLVACRKETTSNDYEALPELPEDIAATLDPYTMATKILPSNLTPVKEPGAALAPCCSITNRMTLKVRFSYTKCGPLRDFIVAPFGDRVLAGPGSSATQPAQSGTVGDFKAFKLTSFNGKTVLDQQVCVTSSGPWNASFTEERRCNNFTPLDTLVINAFGDVVTRVWSGGTPNHPSDVQLVSCRSLGTSQSSCGGLSTCDCQSSTCPATQPCECNLQGW